MPPAVTDYERHRQTNLLAMESNLIAPTVMNLHKLPEPTSGGSTVWTTSLAQFHYCIGLNESAVHNANLTTIVLLSFGALHCKPT